MTFDEFKAYVAELENQLARFDFFLFSETDCSRNHLGDWVAERADLVRADFGAGDFDADETTLMSLWINFRRVEPSPEPHVRRVKAFKGGGRFLQLEAHDGSQIMMFQVSDTDEETLRLMAPLREARDLARERHNQVTVDLIIAAMEMIRDGRAS